MEEDIPTLTVNLSLGSEDIEAKMKTFMTYTIGEALHQSYFLVLVPLGILGNLLSFLVMIEKHNRHMSFSIYICMLAVTDTICLSIAFFRYLNMAHDMDLAPSQMWFCKAIAAVLFTSSMCSTLFILSMTFERCYSIIRPHKAASFNTVKRAKVSIVFIILFSIGYNSPLWLLSSQVIGKSRNCYAYANAMSSIPGQIYYWSANILQFILPFLFLLMMNTVIIYTLSNRSKFRAEYQGQGQSPGHGQGQVPCQIQKVKTSEKQIFVMLLLVTFSYLILNTPTYLLVFLNFTNIKKQTAHSLALFHLLYSVAQKALYTNYGINFLLYVMSGQKFRKDLILLLKNMLNLITCGREVREQSTPDTSVFNTSSSVH